MVEKIKVVHITTVHKRTDVRILQKECTSLANNGYQVHLIVADGKGDEITNSGVQIHDIGIFSGRIKRITSSYLVAFKKAMDIDATIYHLHDPELLLCGLKLKKENKKVIFDSHEDIYSNISEKNYIPNFLKPILSFFLSLIQTYVLKRIDGVISVTPHICDKLKRVNSNIAMITNYPIIHKKDIQKGNITKSLVFAGGVMNQWKHEFVLEALSFCEDKNIVYNICGPTYPDYMAELQKHKNWNKVNYYGIVSKAEVEIIMSESSIGMATLSYGKNVGGKIGTIGNTKLFEYMEAGIPFICTDFILWKEIVDKYECGICVDPTNPKQIAKAIDDLILDQEKIIKMGLNGRKAAEEVFNWSSQEKLLLVFYEKCLGDN
ncbi:MAG: glycosyltransferase [Bacteroidales bacterium]|jgi:glycosyltransferase involved in cell wall biosynthesis